MDSELSIDSKYKNELNALRRKMEAETGKLFQFTINQFNTEESLKLGDFLKRKNKIEVTIFPTYEKVELEKGENIDVISAIQSLSGIYSNIEELQDRIRYVRRENNIFDLIEVSINNNDIYMCGGGSLSLCHTIGKWKYLGAEDETEKVKDENCEYWDDGDECDYDDMEALKHKKVEALKHKKVEALKHKKVEVTIHSTYKEKRYVVDANHEGKLDLLRINIDPIIQNISGTYEQFKNIVEHIDQIAKLHPSLPPVEIEENDNHIYICESNDGFSELIKIGTWKYV